MELVRISSKNLDQEHICCAISNNKDCQVSSKKAWLRQRLDEGLVFLKGDIRGKCFIEYIPAEYAWAPIDADDYMYIDCLWVSGQLKGQGNSNLLLEECIRDSKTKGKKGLVVLSSGKKLGFLSDPKYLKYKGFETADTASPYFELMYLPFDKGADKPRFKPCVKDMAHTDKPDGFALYYTNQCPFNAKYVPLVEEAARAQKLPFRSVLIDSREKAQSAPAAVTTYAVFYNGSFVSNEILSVPKFEKLVKKLTE